MKICIVSYMYPNLYSSSDQVFVKMLVDEFVRQGHECLVVCPFNTLHYRHISSGSYSYLVNDKPVRVVSPNYLSASNLRIGRLNVSEYLHSKAVNRALKKMNFKPDVIYCHFWKQGLKSFPFARRNNIPLFVASGECEIFLKNVDGHLSEFSNYVKGVICVSTKNKEESIAKKLTVEEKCLIAPNSINVQLFQKKEKQLCRNQLGLPLDKFIIIYVGWFANRKGSLRVSDAISKIESNDVYSLFIGSGPDVPQCQNVLFCGKVDHNNLLDYLNAADAFVLPTLQEGCCNAVVEAMACGLPIISSNLPFNWDVLDNENSIMIDPMSIDEIKEAIERLKEDKSLQERMSSSSLNKAKNLTLEDRAKRIINFMQSKLNQ